MMKSNGESISFLVNGSDSDVTDNCFDIIRIISAYIVCLSHSFRHMNVEKPRWTLFFTDGSVGVMCFFVMTGFLMMYSWDKVINNKNMNYLKFLIKRMFRLYPAIWGSFFFVCLIDFFVFKIPFELVSFVKYSVLYNFFGIGDGYGSNGITNGVMWTILIDVFFYIITPLIYRMLRNISIYKSLIIILLFWLLSFFDKHVIELFQGVPFGDSIGLFLCLLYEFLIGCFFYFHIDLVFNKNHLIVLFLFVSFIAVYYIYWNSNSISKNFVMHSPIIAPLCCIVVVILAYSFGRIKLPYDVSYGIFIYHMIVIGFLKFYNVKGIVGVILTPIIASIMALFSFFLIERQANVFVNKIIKDR